MKIEQTIWFVFYFEHCLEIHQILKFLGTSWDFCGLSEKKPRIVGSLGNSSRILWVSRKSARILWVSRKSSRSLWVSRKSSRIFLKLKGFPEKKITRYFSVILRYKCVVGQS